MPLPRMDEIPLQLLKLIMNQKIYSIREAKELLIKKFGLTQTDLSIKDSSGIGKFNKNVILSYALLVLAGLVYKNSKPFVAMDEAKKIIRRNPSEVTISYLNELAKAKQERKLKKEKDLTRQNLIKKYDLILKKIKMTETEFEHFSGLVLSKVYNVDFFKFVEITPPKSDGGIDGIIHLGEDTKSKVYFQSKFKDNRYPIGEPLLRDFTGALVARKGNKGYFVTTTRFSGEAIRYVEKLKDPEINKNITLIDGHKLMELVFKYNLENELGVNCLDY